MESISRTFYILLFITSSWVAAETKQKTTGYAQQPSCPPLGLGEYFEVATIQTRSRMYGCAYLEKDTVLSRTPLLNLWLERPVEISVHGHCDDLTSMDHFVFECITKYFPHSTDEFIQGWHYLTLLERRPYMKNNTEIKSTLFYRCAVYDVHDASSEGVKIIRMAISAPRVGMMHESQCDGLSKTMGQDNLPYVPEGRRTWPNGSLYLYLLGKPLIEPPPKKEEPKV
ncbi:uncharacterized protein LOC132926788 [Rhopalosiphum padi]|uniref:uncharacterized protein LOC132926788 n=1 Tax=Rhopalosiphum padi TaxID=40932 RepID=UPI00298E766E|nr:uncharacterized protein LOC132926788 [Rhopalosiphum padi]